MRYMARRIRTGEWLSRDLVLTDVESTLTLSGPSTIMATLEPGFNEVLWPDGLRAVEDWGTIVYECEDGSGAQIRNHGIVVPPTQYDDTARVTFAGVSSYANGYIYTDSKLWGPQAAVKRRNKPDLPSMPRPDPIAVFVDHWEWMQRIERADLGVTITGDLTTGGKVLIGNNAEPYRLRKWEAPDLGQEIETLAQMTPFDFVERAKWADDAHTEVNHTIEVGYPRLGAKREDLRFAMGENIVLVPSVSSIESFGNHLIGVGRGEAGPSMAFRELQWDDGRLHRSRVVTDKTASNDVLARRLEVWRASLAQRYDVTQIAVIDHPNARLSRIQLGDDIRVLAEHPEFGQIDLWVRVLGISRGESSEAAVLSTSASVFFSYKPTEELA